MKSCPLCGSRDLYLLTQEQEEYYIFCNNCKTSFYNEKFGEDSDQMAAWWNDLPRAKGKIIVQTTKDFGSWWTKEFEHVCGNCGQEVKETKLKMVEYCPHCGVEFLED
jgi:DNA-directed RNA polymerase subunit M/transcription elongation factor TFIIS